VAAALLVLRAHRVVSGALDPRTGSAHTWAQRRRLRLMVTTLVVSLVVLIGLGMPIAFSMGLAAVIALVVDGSVPLLVLPQKMYSSLDSFPLLAIPLFILAGALMNISGITDKLVVLSRSLVGHLRGGLGQVTVLTSVLFSTISGSAAASAAAVGG